MCSIKDIISAGFQDLKAWKKRNRISLILFFLTLVVYIGINSYVNTIEEDCYVVENTLASRICTVLLGSEQEVQEFCDMMNDNYGDDERVREVLPMSLHTFVKWVDAKEILYVQNATMDIRSCFEAVLDYDYKGEKRIPKENEIIAPRYLCDIGMYDSKNLGDGDELIGRTIKVNFETSRGLYNKEYEFKVIGTYDNIKTRDAGNIFYVNPQIPVDLKNLQNDEDIEEIDEIMEELTEELGEEIVLESQRKYYVGVYVNEGYDIDAFIDELYKENEKYFMGRYRFVEPTLVSYYSYIRFVGNIISMMILIVAIINIIISSINEVNDRKWEFALKMSMGYRKKDIVSIFFVEKLVNLIKALALATFIVFLFCVEATYISRNFLEYWKRDYVYTLSFGNIAIAVVLIIFAGLIGTLVANAKIGQIEIASELKAGE